METKQTAVDFLLHELSEIIGIIAPDAFSAALMKIKYDEAKSMEKEQSRKDYYAGVKDEMQNIGNDFEDYYNKTYGK